jgi:NAD-dependent SIR2 family protein deacetylase
MLDEHREEQLHGGYREVACEACTTRVLVRRMSSEQTTIQWPGAPACPELLDRPAAGTPVLRCAALSRAIRAAAVRGELPPARP